MSSPVTTLMSTIATTWAALTPPDRTTIAYRELTGHRAHDGTSGDRSFRWRLPQRTETIAERGPDASEVEWALVAELRITAAGRGSAALADAVANETNLLARALEKLSNYGAATILEVTLDGVSAEIEPESGDAICEFRITALTWETD